MTTLNIISKMIIAISIAFGFWYLVFWFVTSEPNLFIWGGLIKFLYLFFGFLMWAKLEYQFNGLFELRKNKINQDEQ